MSGVIVRRLATSVVLVLAVSMLTFGLVSTIPGDAASTILGARASPDQYERLREELGLSEPVWEQYSEWLVSALHGDLGSSIVSGQPVTSALNTRLPVTLVLIGAGVLLTAVAGVGLGILTAVRGTRLGQCVDVASLSLWAVPSFWLGLVLVELLAVAVPAFPATGYVGFTESPLGWAHSLVLPVFTIAAAGVAAVAKQTRDAMLDVLDRGFVRNLRASGIPERSIVLRHALKNAAIPIITVLGVQSVTLLGGTVVVETIFALPGLGSLAVQATTQHDLPVVLGVALYFTVIVVLINLVLDVAYSWLNPKVRVV